MAAFVPAMYLLRQKKGLKQMRVNWKRILIGLGLGLLLGCEPVDIPNYNIFTGYETKGCENA